MNENDTKPTQTSDESTLQNELNRIESSQVQPKPMENVADKPVLPVFTCPNFVLDFLQDKPVKIQKMVLTSKLSVDQKKAVEHIFNASTAEIEINRAALKSIIEKIGTKYPEIQPFLTSESVFFVTFGFGMHERSEMIKAELETLKQKEG